MQNHVLVIHAYSRRNSGDGLLVDETCALIREALGGHVEIRVLALDANSFSPEYDSFAFPWADSSRRGRMLAAAMPSAVLRAAKIRSAELFGWADCVVAVGGGYLRAGTLREAVTTAINHLPQLRLAASSSRPTFYMPQSVGPLRGPVGWALQRFLTSVDRVALRDDRSMTELRQAGVSAERFPDLALLRLAEEGVTPRQSAGPAHVGIVARDLPRWPTFSPSLSELADRLESVQENGPRWYVQSEIKGNDDAGFYRSLGRAGAGRLGDVLTSDQAPAVVISGRLHGALQSVISGVPAIHLSYERKGVGAYSDLGVREYCHLASSFSVDAVVQQAQALLEDPADYWEQVTAALPRLLSRRSRLIEEMRDALRPSAET